MGSGIRGRHNHDDSPLLPDQGRRLDGYGWMGNRDGVDNRFHYRRTSEGVSNGNEM